MNRQLEHWLNKIHRERLPEQFDVAVAWRILPSSLGAGLTALTVETVAWGRRGCTGARNEGELVALPRI